MALGGRNCPFCRAYNALSETTCIRCAKWLPPEPIALLLREPFITEFWATKLLAAVSIVVFALEMASAGPHNVGLLRGMPMSSMLRFGALTNGLESAEPWRLLASCFVHMGVLHVLMNLFVFGELGRVAEREFKGPRLVIAYVLTGVVGFIVSALWYAHTPYATAGASGAVFGIDGLLIGAMLARRDKRWVDALVRTVVHSFLFYFVLGTNQAAHLGGLATGLALGYAYSKENRPWRIATAVNIASAVSFVAIIGSIVLSIASPVWREAKEHEDRRSERERSAAPPSAPDDDADE